MPRLPISIAAFLALLLPFTPASARPSPLTLEPAKLRLADGTDLAVERGTFQVPEDRRDPGSRRIGIGFLRLKSTSPKPGNPIVYLAGGPGGSGIAAARGPRQSVFLALREVADVIVLDQRGTGISNHLPPCSAERRLDPAAGLSEATLSAYYRATLQHCVGRWRAAGVSVGGYTTEQNARDLEALRLAIGAKRLDVWAISYGTHLALATMRLFPNSIGRVVLASTEGLDQTVKLPASVDAVFAHIDAGLGGGLVERMRRVHTRFDATPATFSFDGAGSAPVTFTSDSFALRMMAGFVAKNPDGYAQLVGAYAALDAGKTAPIAPLLWQFFFREPLSVGMGELMDLSSGISDARLAEVRRQAPGSLSGMAVNFPMPQLRGAVPGMDLGDAYRREVRSRIPVLLFEGDLDVRTPIEEQRVAAAGLANARRIIFRNGGHDLFEVHRDVPAIMVAFLSGRKLPASELILSDPKIASSQSGQVRQ